MSGLSQPLNRARATIFTRDFNEPLTVAVPLHRPARRGDPSFGPHRRDNTKLP